MQPPCIEEGTGHSGVHLEGVQARTRTQGSSNQSSNQGPCPLLFAGNGAPKGNMGWMAVKLEGGQAWASGQQSQEGWDPMGWLRPQLGGVTCARVSPGPPQLGGCLLGLPIACGHTRQVSGPHVHCTSS